MCWDRDEIGEGQGRVRRRRQHAESQPGQRRTVNRDTLLQALGSLLGPARDETRVK